MLNRSILARGAFIGLALVGLVALADSMARAQLAQAVKASRVTAAPVIVHMAGAAN